MTYNNYNSSQSARTAATTKSEQKHPLGYRGDPRGVLPRSPNSTQSPAYSPARSQQAPHPTQSTAPTTSNTSSKQASNKHAPLRSAVPPATSRVTSSSPQSSSKSSYSAKSDNAHLSTNARTTSLGDPDQKPPHPILYQNYFKSVGPRTYAAQLKCASNGNHYLVLTEGKRDKKTNEPRKTSIYIFSEDFEAYIDLIRDMAIYIKNHPVPQDVANRQAGLWKKHKGKQSASRPNSARKPCHIDHPDSGDRQNTPHVNRSDGRISGTNAPRFSNRPPAKSGNSFKRSHSSYPQNRRVN